jgi:hypothetical protein
MQARESQKKFYDIFSLSLRGLLQVVLHRPQPLQDLLQLNRDRRQLILLEQFYKTFYGRKLRLFVIS